MTTKISKMMKSDNIYRIARYGTFCFFAVVLTYIAYRSLADWFLWYDEAGQFYISKGLCHYSEPFAPYSGVCDVFHYNRYFNLDPGGFSVLLHYWSMLSNHYAYLRLLPLLFFLVFIFVAYKIGMQLFHDHFPAILLASVFLISPIITHLAGELRAYSMEMFGVLISLYYLKRIDNNLSIPKLLILALILNVFMTSRYDFVIYAFVISLCVIFIACKQNGFYKAILPIMIYSFVMLIGVALVYLVSMRYQNASAEPLSYLSYLGRDFRKLITFDMSKRYYIIAGYVLFCHFKRIPQDFYICISLFVCTLYIVLSFANMIPWDEQRAMSATVCQRLAIGIMLLRHLNGKKIVIVILLFGLCGLYKYRKYGGFSIRHSREGCTLYKEIEYCVKNKKCEELIFIGRWYNASIRYSFEEYDWGEKLVGVYPSQFYLGNANSHNQTGEKIVKDIKKAEDIDARFYIFSNLTLETVPPECFKKDEDFKYIYIKEQ